MLENKPSLEDALAHYGVKGMRWGVRRTAKQLGESRKSAITKLGKRQSRIKKEAIATKSARVAKMQVRVSEIDKQINSLPPGIYGTYAKFDFTNQRNETQRAIKRNKKELERMKKSRLTPTQKKVLIGAAAVGTIALAVAVSKNADHETLMALGRQAQSKRRHGDVFARDKSLADPTLSASAITSKVSSRVNPNYSSPGGQMNCRRSTFAHELRRRGYDVHATTSSIGYSQNETSLINALTTEGRNPITAQSLSAMIVTQGSARARGLATDKRANPATTETVKTISKIGEVLVRQPNRARGEVVFNQGRFGHSMAYEVIDGAAHIFDSQKGVHYPATAEGMTKLQSKWGITSEATITRLDNLELDTKWLGRWAKSYD